MGFHITILETILIHALEGHAFFEVHVTGDRTFIQFHVLLQVNRVHLEIWYCACVQLYHVYVVVLRREG